METSKSLVHDRDLYEAKRVNGRWEIIRTPSSPLFKPTRVELSQLPPTLYQEFSAPFLPVPLHEQSS